MQDTQRKPSRAQVVQLIASMRRQREHLLITQMLGGHDARRAERIDRYSDEIERLAREWPDITLAEVERR